MSAIDETNLAIRQMLGFTVGYYGSVLQVTGNSSWARMRATNYFQNGTAYIANVHPEYGTSLSVTKIDMQASWFSNCSYSAGDLAVRYNLTSLGIYGITYETSSKLMVNVNSSASPGEARITVTKDDGEPLVNLGRSSFKFYNYTFTNSTWQAVTPSSEPKVFANGTYLIDVPWGIDSLAYTVQVEDSRGLIVAASSFSRYTCTMNWDQKYSTLPDTTLVVELLQNGTMKWLGQNLTQTKPVPPIPVRSIHVNQTINNVDQEVPFQIEDWASDYKIPLGLTSNASIFSSRNMIVFLVNPRTLNKTTIWWDGRDTATQTPYAYTSGNFSVNTFQRTLTNGILTLQIDFSGSASSFKVNSTIGTVSSTAEFMRINNKVAHYGWSEPTYAIMNGTVRVVVQHEVEWNNNGVTGCPNVYAQIVITLPANATYYTYQLRLMFANSSQTRNVTDLCPIKLTTSIKQFLTENGTTAGGYPIISNVTAFFYDYNSSCLAHHWSQMNSTVSKGAGIMFTDTANLNLYFFDNDTTKTGGLRTNSTAGTIELLPVSKTPVSFADYKDITWNGAVVTFNQTTPIYKEESGTITGLWILVEYPPALTVIVEN